jgi:rhodanese-related sulfurtransferase
VNEIDPGELAERRGEEHQGLRVVDIRSPEAFRRGHIPGSENIPMNQLPNRAEALDDADTVVTVCPHGQASLQAARILGAYDGLQEATIYSLAGGLTAWDGDLEGGGEASTANAEQSDAPF